MNSFLVYFAVIALGVAWFLSRADWLKMLVLVPLGALVPAFFGTGSMCGADFILHLTEPGHCSVEGEPFRLYAAYFVFGLVAVLGASVLVKLGRIVWEKTRG